MVYTTLKLVGYHRSQGPKQTLWQRLRHVKYITEHAPAVRWWNLWSWLTRGDTGNIPIYEEVEYDPWQKN